MGCPSRRTPLNGKAHAGPSHPRSPHPKARPLALPGPLHACEPPPSFAAADLATRPLARVCSASQPASPAPSERSSVPGQVAAAVLLPSPSLWLDPPLTSEREWTLARWSAGVQQREGAPFFAAAPLHLPPLGKGRSWGVPLPRRCLPCACPRGPPGGGCRPKPTIKGAERRGQPKPPPPRPRPSLEAPPRAAPWAQKVPAGSSSPSARLNVEAPLSPSHSGPGRSARLARKKGRRGGRLLLPPPRVFCCLLLPLPPPVSSAAAAAGLLRLPLRARRRRARSPSGRQQRRDGLDGAAALTAFLGVDLLPLPPLPGGARKAGAMLPGEPRRTAPPPRRS